MRRVKPALLSIGLLLVACAGPVPDPAELERNLPGAREVDPARRAELDVQVAEARVALAASRVVEAKAAVQRVLEIDPRHARALAVLGQCRLAAARESTPPALDEYRLAEGELRRASAIAPADPLVALLHAEYLVADGHLSAAALRVDEGLAANPDDQALLELGGRVRFDLGDERAAIPLLSRRVALAAADVDSVWRLAQCHARLAAATFDRDERRRHATAARDAFHLNAALSPTDEEPLLGEAWAMLLLLPERIDDASCAPILALYDRAARLDPASPEPAFGRGVALARAGRDAEARAAWREALSLDPRHLASLLELAASHAAAQEITEARVLLERALALSPPADERGRIEDWLKAHEI